MIEAPLSAAEMRWWRCSTRDVNAIGVSVPQLTHLWHLPGFGLLPRAFCGRASE
jgi:hypothetical protein